MKIERYVRRIRKEFPNLTFKNVTLPHQGIDHVALQLDEKWIFRFPKLPKYKKLFPDEVVLLEQLHRRLPLAIPHYDHIARDRSFGGYRMIIGESLQVKTYRRCSAQAKRRMQTQMAKFLSRLHAMPLSFAKKHRVETQHPRTMFTRRLREYRRYRLLQTLTKNEQNSVRAFLKECHAHLDDAYTPCFIHCDLYTDHVFVDAKHTRIVGIIDFGDRAIFDPAVDFSGLWAYGREFVENVYRQYTSPKDPTFLTRSCHRNKLGALGWLSIARHKKWKAEKEAYAHFKKYFK